jgi:hypothetical protein
MPSATPTQVADYSDSGRLVRSQVDTIVQWTGRRTAGKVGRATGAARAAT